MQNIRTVQRLPKVPDETTMFYYLPPRKIKGDDKSNSRRNAARDERTDRNDGCLVKDIEQRLLYESSVAVIGLGGMGGYQCDTLIRLGIGELWIADNGVFDQSNLQRQWGSQRTTIGMAKAIATGRKMREIADDYHLYVCHKGFCEETAEMLVSGRDVVIDMIEFWALADRIYLHRICAKHGVAVINWNSIVHASFGSRYDYTKKATPRELDGYATQLERFLKITYDRARYLQTRYDGGTITLAEKTELADAVFRVFIPEETEYYESAQYSTIEAFRCRLLQEGKAPVLSTNPMFAAGVCATEVYFEIIRQKSPIKRNIRQLKAFPHMTKIDIGKKTMRTIDLRELESKVVPSTYVIRLVRDSNERARAVTFISENMFKSHGAFPPPEKTPEHIFIALSGSEIVGAIALEFGSHDSPLPFESFFDFDKSFAEVPYVREETVYYSRWNSTRRKLGPILWLYATMYAAKRGIRFTSATAKPVMFEFCERALGFRWLTVPSAAVRTENIGEEERSYFFSDISPMPCLGVLSDQLGVLENKVGDICVNEKITIEFETDGIFA